MVSSAKIAYEPLDLFSLPLTGRILIEASAGTGKTYSIALIYLRLLLGIGNNAYPYPLEVDQILVVTFTKAATEELRYRIRKNIHQLRIACLRGEHEDENFQQLLDCIDNKALAIERLYAAEQYMDEAAIYTIHGFCQRVLAMHAFESGALFEQTVVKDESALFLRVVKDFWRHYFTPLPEDLASIVWQNWADPESLLKDIYPFLSGELPRNVSTSIVDLSQVIQDFDQQASASINQLKTQWLAHYTSFTDIIAQSGVNKRSYSKNSLPKWLNSITAWANTVTQEHSLASDLHRFSQQMLLSKTDNDKQAPVHAVFTQIDQLLQVNFSLKTAILFAIVNIIKQQLNLEKQRLAQIGFDDLLTNLYHGLQQPQGQQLAAVIAEQYPVAMIDEFQDTDPIQYQIFNHIYPTQPGNQAQGLLFIGDPKQAIYGFRGADVFTYMQAKTQVDKCYTMTTNWRSSVNMVAAVNSLFTQQSQPFIFAGIPYVPMQAATSNKARSFYANNNHLSALHCYLLPPEINNASDYLEFSADYCAEQIATWLATDSYFIDGQLPKQALSSSDIAILVRTGREAEIIRQKLSLRGIKSVYVSNHQSVFATVEARELMRILQAILLPTNQQAVCSALATQLLGVNMAEIEVLSDDQGRLEQLIDEFMQYQLIWSNYGVLVMLRKLMAKRNLAENLLSRLDGERILTNFMHLSELLQEAGLNFDTPHSLLRWFIKQINQPDLNIDNHEQRLDSDENLVNIITIHKSKGLEYPIVCLPFIGHYRASSSQLYHDRQDYSLHYAFPHAYQNSDEIEQLIEQERLAEDMRLLYVALTRSIYHCCVGLAGITNRNSSVLSTLNAAIGYLLLNGDEQPKYAILQQRLTEIAASQLTIVDLPINQTQLSNLTTNWPVLSANIFHRKLDNHWRVTSYSELTRSSDDALMPLARQSLYETISLFDIDALDQTGHHRDQRLLDQQDGKDNIHCFPKGAMVGTLLHECFEKMDFSAPIAESLLNNLLHKLTLPEHWFAILSDWFSMLVSVPLNQQGLALSQIKSSQRLDELQFYLPINHCVTADNLDKLLRQYDVLSSQREPLSFMSVQGMLKGFIDMVFEWQGKYYIVDYKSNWLGESSAAYHPAAINQAMAEHRYDLQYQLYSLALHRYLKSRLNNYQYAQHFGGVYYLFIRGMDQRYPNYGIFYTKPEQLLIEQLDQLLAD